MAETVKSFEANLEELEEVVAGLEQGDLPLDEAIKLFQRGMELTKLCGKRLSTAEEEIQKLVAEQDKFKLQPLGGADADDN
jgi:exodeoxyribonuclease VII small subunit